MSHSDRERQAGRWARWLSPRWRAPVALAWVPLCALPVLAAFPPLEWSALGWVALAPLAAGLRGGRGGPWTWTAAGWGFGWVFYGAQFAWLYAAFVGQAGMGWWHFVNVFGLLLAVLALGPAMVLGATRALWLRWGLSPLVMLPLGLAALDALLGVAPFGGLGWGSLAGPQAHTWAARLLVPVLGGSGLVLALGLVNAGWGAWGAAGCGAAGRAAAGLEPPGAAAVEAGRGAWAPLRRFRPEWRLAAGATAWAVLTAFCAWPAPPLVLAPSPPATAAPWVLLVPGDLSLRALQAQRDAPAPLRHYLVRTLAAAHALLDARQAAADGNAPALILWPESALPGPAERGQTLVTLGQVGDVLGADLLLGSNGLRQGRETNALFLVSGTPFDFRRYDKQRLVPFGEYVPPGFGWLFRHKITAGEADYVPGSGPPLLPWRGGALGPAICFESILPGHMRAAVQAGAVLLVAAANDAWLSPAARRQHLQLTALRGLEAGRDVLFVANRGWAAHLRGGQALAIAHWEDPALLVRPVPRAGRTPVVRWGLWPLAGAALPLLAAALAGRVRKPSGGVNFG